jgi:hypothetical protein
LRKIKGNSATKERGNTFFMREYLWVNYSYKNRHKKAIL